MTESQQIHFKTAVLMLLCIATVWFFNGYPRYQNIGGELLHNPALAGDLAGWSGAGTQAEPLPDGGVRLWSNGDDFVQISQLVDSAFPGALLQLSCSIKTHQVINGARAWDRARVLLVAYGRDGKALYNRPHLLAKRDGSQDWEQVEKVFAIGADVAKVRVVAQMSRTSGELLLKSFSLRPVVLKTAFKQYRLALMYVWLLVALWVAWPFVRSSLNSPARAWVLALAFGIFLGVLTPEPIKEAVGAAIWPATERNPDAHVGAEFNDGQVFSLALKLPPPDIFKAGHFVLFGMLAMVLASGKAYRLPVARLLFYLLLLALVSEVLQLFMPGRGPQLGDIAVDGAGALAGLLLWRLWGCRTLFKIVGAGA